MPINSTLAIQGSVGQGGRNQRQDVRAVQTRLNELMSPPRQTLVVDGLNGPKTTGMIRDFQSAVVGLMRPDGRVDPGRGTQSKLNDPLSSQIWKGQNMTPANQPGSANPMLNSEHQRAREQMDQAAADLNMGHLYDAFEREVLDSNEWNMVKDMLSTINTGADARDLLLGWQAMRGVGISNREMVTAVRDNRGGKAFFDQLKRLGASNAAVTHLRTAATAADRVLLVMVAVEVVAHLRNRRWGPAAAVIYQVGIGGRMPWASLLNGLQGLIKVLYPGRDDSRFFTALNALEAVDPIGLGGVGVDAAITGSAVLIEAVMTRQINMVQIRQLNDRMHEGSASFFAAMGENLGDGVYDLRTVHPTQDYRLVGQMAREIGKDISGLLARLRPGSSGGASSSW